MARRAWTRFHLSTAVAVMLAVGLLLGVYTRNIMTEENDWNQELRHTLDNPVSMKFDKAPLDELTFGAFRIHAQSPIPILFSPLLKERSITLNIENQRLREALNALCEPLNWEWKGAHGAIFIYPASHPPPVPDESKWNTSWKAYHSLQSSVYCTALDTPFAEHCNYLGQTARTPVVIDPAVIIRGDTPISFCHSRAFKLRDALTCVCFLADAQWTLKEDSNGTPVLHISPRK